MNLNNEIQKSLWHSGSGHTENYGPSIGNSLQKEVINLDTSTIYAPSYNGTITFSGKRILLKGRTLSEFSDLTNNQKSTCQVAATEGDLARLENKMAVNKENIELLIDILKMYPEMQDKMSEIEELENLINQ